MMMNANEFSDWLNGANLGDIAIYAFGNLTANCEGKEGYEDGLVRDLAYKAAQDGKVYLFQRPAGGKTIQSGTVIRDFEYLAIRADVPENARPVINDRVRKPDQLLAA